MANINNSKIINLKTVDKLWLNSMSRSGERGEHAHKSPSRLKRLQEEYRVDYAQAGWANAQQSCKAALLARGIRDTSIRSYIPLTDESDIVLMYEDTEEALMERMKQASSAAIVARFANTGIGERFARYTFSDIRQTASPCDYSDDHGQYLEKAGPHVTSGTSHTNSPNARLPLELIVLPITTFRKLIFPLFPLHAFQNRANSLDPTRNLKSGETNNVTKAETSRCNGAKSNGPITADGKAASARNARTHGLTGAAVVLAHESQTDYDALLASFLDRYRPSDEAERDLIREMVNARWRLRRIEAMETALMQKAIDDQMAELGEGA